MRAGPTSDNLSYRSAARSAKIACSHNGKIVAALHQLWSRLSLCLHRPPRRPILSIETASKGGGPWGPYRMETQGTGRQSHESSVCFTVVVRPRTRRTPDQRQTRRNRPRRNRYRRCRRTHVGIFRLLRLCDRVRARVSTDVLPDGRSTDRDLLR